MIDLSTLVSGPTGEQVKRGWPGPFVADGLVTVAVLHDEHGRPYFLDPAGVAEGQAEVHKYLIAVNGTITDRDTFEEQLRLRLRERIRCTVARVNDAVLSALPGVGSALADQIVKAVLRAIL